MSAPDVLIHARGLSKSFGGAVAVDGIDFDIRRGEAFGFLGPNGAGKSSTMRMVGCVSPPSAGELSILGLDPVTDGRLIRARLGVVPQEDTLDVELTVRENLLIYGRYFGLPRDLISERTARLLEFVQLADRANDQVEPLSGGMKRRLTIARSLISEPEILLLDEPTTGLDPQSRARMWDEVRKLRDIGTTVFLTTHYLEEADALCDRIAIIDHGKIVALGTPDALKRQVAGDVVVVGTDNASDRVLQLLRGESFVREATAGDGVVRLYVDRGETAMPQIIRALDAEGIVLSSLSLNRPSLDDVFLRQTGRSLRDAA